MKRILAAFFLILGVAGLLVGCENSQEDPTPTYNMVTYKVYHYFEDENGMYTTEGRIDEEFTIRAGTSVIVDEKEVDYFTFNSSISSFHGTVSVNNNTEFYLYYKRTYFTISLVDPINGNGQINSRHGSAITLRVRTHENMIFLGWAYDEQGSQMATLTEMPTNNLSLYAIWQPK